MAKNEIGSQIISGSSGFAALLAIRGMNSNSSNNNNLNVTPQSIDTKSQSVSLSVKGNNQLSGSQILKNLNMPHADKIPNSSDITTQNLVYPTILEGVEFISDIEWKEILTNTAYGNFPTGFVVRNEGLMYIYGSKKFSYTPTDDPLESVIVLIEFYQKQGSIKTTMDKKRELQEFVDSTNSEEELYLIETWNSLKQKAKNIAIRQFVDTMNEKYKLTKDDRDLLQTSIQLGCMNGSIDDLDIDYSVGKIHSVKKLDYDIDKRKFIFTAPELLMSNTSDSNLKLSLNNATLKQCIPDNQYFEITSIDTQNLTCISSGNTSSQSKYKGSGENWNKYLQLIDKPLNRNISSMSNRYSTVSQHLSPIIPTTPNSPNSPNTPNSPILSDTSNTNVLNMTNSEIPFNSYYRPDSSPVMISLPIKTSLKIE